MSGRFCWWLSVITSFCGLTTFLLYNAFIATTEVTDKYGISAATDCPWSEGDPVLFHLRTKLGVNYDAGHWFHMAENFMVQHSILRSTNGLTNASIVIYNFDEDDFESHLNGVTRLMLYLGTISEGSNTKKLHFVSIRKRHRILAQIRKLPSGGTLMIPQSLLITGQAVDLSPLVPVKDRFSNVNINKVSSENRKNVHIRSDSTAIPRDAGTQSSSSSSSVCVKLVGTIGGQWPTPQRGHWFPNRGDIESFRNKIRKACPADAAELNSTRKTKKFKMVLYQRDISRKLANEQEAIQMLTDRLPSKDWEIKIIYHSSQRSPCQLAHSLHDADVLLTPHGFQSMLLLFLPISSILFEVFPYKYFKRGYGPFSNEYGVVHSGVMSPATTWHTQILLSQISTASCMDSKMCRGYARNSDVRLTEHGVKRLLELIHQIYYSQGSLETTSVTNSNISLSQLMNSAERSIPISGFYSSASRSMLY